MGRAGVEVPAAFEVEALEDEDEDDEQDGRTVRWVRVLGVVMIWGPRMCRVWRIIPGARDSFGHS